MIASLSKLFVSAGLVALLAACGGDASPDSRPGDDDHGHSHGPGDGHDHDHPDDGAGADEHDHEHDEAELGTAKVGELDVVFAQGHGPLAAGEEAHLVVKLPYSDGGATTVRAWLGTADRLQSLVAKGVYASSHDDYDVHATAPDPLPDGVRWWVELEKPDGTRVVGSVAPLLAPGG